MSISQQTASAKTLAVIYKKIQNRQTVMENHIYFKQNLEKMLSAYSGNPTALVSYRHKILQNMYSYYLQNGFPLPRTEEKMSLFPSHFQEAIYDSINWEQQNADLLHLELSFELDCIFQNEGKKRKELTKTEFKKYMAYSNSIIQKATKPR